MHAACTAETLCKKKRPSKNTQAAMSIFLYKDEKSSNDGCIHSLLLEELALNHLLTVAPSLSHYRPVDWISLSPLGSLAVGHTLDVSPTEAASPAVQTCLKYFLFHFDETL